jgi:hypothetical protein
VPPAAAAAEPVAEPAAVPPPKPETVLSWESRPRGPHAGRGPFELGTDHRGLDREVKVVLHFRALDPPHALDGGLDSARSAMRSALLDGIKGHEAYPRYRRLQAELAAALASQQAAEGKAGGLKIKKARLMSDPQRGCGKDLLALEEQIRAAEAEAAQHAAEADALRPHLDEARQTLDNAAAGLCTAVTFRVRDELLVKLDALADRVTATLGPSLDEAVGICRALAADVRGSEGELAAARLLDEPAG